MTKVFIRNARYDTDEIRPIIQEMFDSMGPDWITPGMRVVVKPNMLMAAAPDQAIVTHPLVVRCVAAYMLGKGAEVQVSDSAGRIGLHVRRWWNWPPWHRFRQMVRVFRDDAFLRV